MDEVLTSLVYRDPSSQYLPDWILRAQGEGWELFGSPYSHYGQHCQEMVEGLGKGMVSDYKILQEASDTALALEVHSYQGLGWELYGSPYSHESRYCQAMVQWEKPDAD